MKIGVRARRAVGVPLAVLLMAGGAAVASGGPASAWAGEDCLAKGTLSHKTGFGTTHVDMRLYLCPDAHNWVEGYLGSNLASEGAVWLDVSRDGGKTWKVTQKVNWGGDYSRQTRRAGVGYQYDGPGWWVRACGNWGSITAYCTSWH
ncbi:hypothetical protein ABZT28_28500 [Streptomyces sp. NPDC005388]|uniref:hypothetical protein n=1 Tax=Streptomyces sp. NPDC005388 TaxID=3156717 RepID=UPI0033A03C98